MAHRCDLLRTPEDMIEVYETLNNKAKLVILEYSYDHKCTFHLLFIYSIATRRPLARLPFSSLVFLRWQTRFATPPFFERAASIILATCHHTTTARPREHQCARRHALREAL